MDGNARGHHCSVRNEIGAAEDCGKWCEMLIGYQMKD